MVYETLREVMIADGLTVTEGDMHAWHGAKKEAVLEHFAREGLSAPRPRVVSRVVSTSEGETPR